MASFSPVHTIGNQMIEAVRLHQRVSKQQAHQMRYVVWLTWVSRTPKVVWPTMPGNSVADCGSAQ